MKCLGYAVVQQKDRDSLELELALKDMLLPGAATFRLEVVEAACIAPRAALGGVERGGVCLDHLLCRDKAVSLFRLVVTSKGGI